MKKILSSLLICWVLFSSVSSAFAENSYSEYLSKVQSTIENMTPTEITSFQQKIATTIKETDNEEIKDFLKSVLLLTAQDTTESTQDTTREMQADIIQPQEVPVKQTYDELTTSEQRAVAYEISKLQANLKEEAQSMLSQIISSWNSLSRYTEQWSVTAEMNMKIDNFGSLQGGINISEYIAETQVFDSSISADISGFYNINSDYIWEIDLSGKTNIDLIQKWSSTYLLMNNTQFNSSDESIEIELTPMLILGYFSQENIESHLDLFFSENLMEAYGKTENGYLLRPTKYFCDSGKKLTNVFDPFNGKECSEKQYQNMLEDFMDSGVDITLQTGNETVLRISNMASIDAYEIVDIHFIWKNASFHEMTMTVKDSFDDTEYVSAHYIVNDMLKIHVPKQAYDPEFLLDMDLGRNGSIKKIDLQASYEDEMIFIWNYDNGLLSTSLEIDTPEMQASCSFDWNAYMSFLEIDGGCDISSYLIGTDSETLRIDSSLTYNWVDRKNNFDWNFEAISDENNYFNFDITSVAKRTSSWVYEIRAPKSTINYTDFLKEVSSGNSYYYDDYEYETDYEYEYNSYDEYDEGCYIYDSGNTTCYEYYDDKTITCKFDVETGEESCETYEYGYSIEETTFDDFDRVCYNYDSWDSTWWSRGCYGGIINSVKHINKNPFEFWKVFLFFKFSIFYTLNTFSISCITRIVSLKVRIIFP